MNRQRESNSVTRTPSNPPAMDFCNDIPIFHEKFVKKLELSEKIDLPTDNFILNQNLYCSKVEYFNKTLNLNHNFDFQFETQNFNSPNSIQKSSFGEFFPVILVEMKRKQRKISSHCGYRLRPINHNIIPFSDNKTK